VSALEEDASPTPILSRAERAAAFEEGPPKFPRKYIWIGIAIVAVLGIGGAYADQSFNVPSVAPKRETNQAKAVSNTLSHFVGLKVLSNKVASPLPLVDQAGRPFSLTEVRGKTVLLTFLDPTCADICPVVAAELKRAVADLGGAASGLAVVTVNANPGALGPLYASTALSRDKLSTLPDPYFLTGTIASLNRVWSHYGIAIEYDPANGQLAHTNAIYVISPTGRLDYVLEPFGDESTKGTFSLPSSQIDRFATGIAHYVVAARR
jgi:cytochrome oxidase Cu insertion factor (SCO1/SenC/PrrC family)